MTNPTVPAEHLLAERSRRGARPLHQPPALSTAQDAALRAIVQGEVTITDGRPIIRSNDIRVSINTIRSLESRGLVIREPCLLRHQDERVHLPAGRPAGRPAAPAARPATH
ncbi:hypothetical protein AB0O05_03000 [Streptomyces sp. NPDC093084]|uniref:hypothetical protein n=1 Tax=Streptomyces sp. NPDC093084 TaxID=3155197 RepID=UPI0034216AF4